jgi:LPS sulfotransferase NodH
MTFHLDELPIKLVDLLELLNQPKVIVLYRANILEQFISLCLATKTGNWHLKKPKAARPIWIDPDECQAFVDRERRMWHESMTALAGQDAHVLSYEYLTARPDAAMNDVFRFLGVEPEIVRTRWVRTNPKPAWLKVTNYAQLAEHGLPRTAVQRLPYLTGRLARLAA